MPPPPKAGPAPVARSVLFVTSPCLWPHGPYLPVVRRRPGKAEELGVVVDLWRACGLTPNAWTSSRGSGGSPRRCWGDAYSGVWDPRRAEAIVPGREVPAPPGPATPPIPKSVTRNG